MKNKILILSALVCFTFLLLEAPKQYYKIRDQKLLSEQGVEKYEKTQTSTMDDFSLKIDSFFNYVSDNPTSGIGYTNVLTADETSVVLENIREELQLLAGNNLKVLLSAMESSPEHSRCFTAQVFHRKEETQYIWEVGFLELLTPKNNLPFAIIIFDSDSYQILMTMWEFPKEEMQNVTESYIYNWDSAVAYYEDISKEIYIEDYLYAGVIYPVPIPYEFVESSSLFYDLYELSQYFWSNDYYDEMIQE